VHVRIIADRADGLLETGSKLQCGHRGVG
jgi:hypothetical protein